MFLSPRREKPKLDRMMITGNDPNELDLTLEGTQHTDISYNHTLVNPELQRCEQRMFHRPRLLKSASSPYRRWMMCAAASNKKKSYKTGRFNDDGSVFVNASTQGGGGEERGGVGVDHQKVIGSVSCKVLPIWKPLMAC